MTSSGMRILLFAIFLIVLTFCFFLLAYTMQRHHFFANPFHKSFLQTDATQHVSA